MTFVGQRKNKLIENVNIIWGYDVGLVSCRQSQNPCDGTSGWTEMCSKDTKGIPLFTSEPESAGGADWRYLRQFRQWLLFQRRIRR